MFKALHFLALFLASGLGMTDNLQSKDQLKAKKTPSSLVPGIDDEARGDWTCCFSGLMTLASPTIFMAAWLWAGRSI